VERKEINVIGLMSGTSLDGMDIALSSFLFGKGKWNYQIKKALTIAYDDYWQEQLSDAKKLSGLELAKLDIAYGKWIGERVKDFVTDMTAKPTIIASHGHTVFHQPQKRLTLQIGNLNAIHSASAIPVIGNFRILDVLKGGQGAPLVPIGDRLLFSDFDFCLNLGGISNISFDDKQGVRRACDISVCNIALNFLSKKLGKSYDEGGKIAQSGKLNNQLKERLDAISYYQKPLPKSLGLEDIEADVFPLIEETNCSIEDKMYTLVDHIAFQIAQFIKRTKDEGCLLITGGGAYNSFLIKKLQNQLSSFYNIREASPELIDFKEALVFAFLGTLRLRSETNILSSVTGAQEDSVAGDIVGKISL
jgi:anhydro-N-acetylmuramic acid kinase